MKDPSMKVRCVCIILNICSLCGATYLAYENYEDDLFQKNSLELLVSATKATDASRLILEKAMNEACKDSDWILRSMSSLKTDGTTSYFFYKKNAPNEDPTGLFILSGGDIAKLSTKKDIVAILRKKVFSPEPKLVSGDDKGEIFENIKIVLITLAPDWEACASRQKGELIFRKENFFIVFSKKFLDETFSLENKLERNFKILERVVDTAFPDEKTRRIRKGNTPYKGEHPVVELIYGPKEQ